MRQPTAFRVRSSRLPAALTRRVRWMRFELPEQPLLWLSATLTFLTTVALVDRRGPAGAAVGFAVGLRARVARGRVDVRAARLRRAWVGPRDATASRSTFPPPSTGDRRATVNASPGGLALVAADPTLPRGARVVVSVACHAPTGATTVTGVVVDVRRLHRVSGRSESRSISARTSASNGYARCSARSVSACTRGRCRPARRPGIPPRFDRNPVAPRRRITTALEATVVIAISALAIGALSLVFLGYEPMVVRSASMSPTLHVGDVVICAWVPVERVHTGDVVTFGAGAQGPDLITHRVQRITVYGAVVHVVTKGDANTESEDWSAVRGTLVGHVVGTIPGIGTDGRRARQVVDPGAARRREHGGGAVGSVRSPPAAPAPWGSSCPAPRAGLRPDRRPRYRTLSPQPRPFVVSAPLFVTAARFGCEALVRVAGR